MKKSVSQRVREPDWPEVAQAVALVLPKARLHPAVLAWVESHPRRACWTVAFSGGADSLALLLLLWAHWPERRGKFVVLHFNHRLRGREAWRDDQFCQRVCRGLGLTLVTGRWAGRRSGASEAQAREARLGFFVKAMQAKRSKTLWLAQQQDDVAETMLMRIARGSGLGGLVAPRPVQPQPGGRTHLRPLLTVRKQELLAVLRRAGAVWREDASNQTDDHFRNRVRRRVLPAWLKAAERDAVAGAALTRERLEEDEQALELWADKVYPAPGAQTLKMAALVGVPTAVVRRVLHRWLRRVSPTTDLARQGFAQLLVFLERGQPTRFSLGHEGFAVIHGGEMSFRRKPRGKLR